MFKFILLLPFLLSSIFFLQAQENSSAHSEEEMGNFIQDNFLIEEGTTDLFSARMIILGDSNHQDMQGEAARVKLINMIIRFISHNFPEDTKVNLILREGLDSEFLIPSTSYGDSFRLQNLLPEVILAGWDNDLLSKKAIEMVSALVDIQNQFKIISEKYEEFQQEEENCQIQLLRLQLGLGNKIAIDRLMNQHTQKGNEIIAELKSLEQTRSNHNRDYSKVILDDRNRHMLKTIKNLSEAEPNLRIFLIGGAGHFIQVDDDGPQIAEDANVFHFLQNKNIPYIYLKTKFRSVSDSPDDYARKLVEGKTVEDFKGELWRQSLGQSLRRAQQQKLIMQELKKKAEK